jgi:hypothetical protein
MIQASSVSSISTSGGPDVVIRPEASLGGGRLGRLGSQLGVRVRVRQRQVAEHVAELVSPAAELVDHPRGLTAERTPEVGELEQGERRVDWAADVVAPGVDRWLEHVGGRHRLTEKHSGEPKDRPASDQPSERCGEHTHLGLLAKCWGIERELDDQEGNRESDPDSAAPPSTWPGPTPRGKRPSPRPTAARQAPPISFPTASPATTPQVTGEETASLSTPPRRSIPALASANIGTIT